MCPEDDSSATSKTRTLEVVVLGISVEDEFALVETTSGSQEQFVVMRTVAADAWSKMDVGTALSIVVTCGRLGRVLRVVPKATD